MSNKDKKVLVKVYAKKNLGDDLFLHILFSTYPRIQFGLMASESYREFIANYENVTLVPLPERCLVERIICKLENIVRVSLFSPQIVLRHREKYFQERVDEGYNGYIYVGGSIFIQHSPGIKNNDYINSVIPQYIPNAFIVGCNWGPCVNNVYMDFYESKVFPYYKGICFRDTASYNLFKHLDNVRYAPDIVFQYIPGTACIKAKHVGISVIDLSKRKNLHNKLSCYISKMSDTITKLHEDGYKITLFSFCKFEGDEDAIKSIKKKLPQGVNVDCVYYNGDLKGFLQRYGEMETMVTLRFHSLVLSLIYGHKICPIIYSNKVSSLLSDIHYKGFSTSLSEIENVDLVKEIKVSKKVNIALEEYALRASKQFADFEKSF